jgi:chromosome segregation ATPase
MNIKKIIIVFFALSGIFFSCNNDKISVLEEEIATMKEEKHIADSLQNNFITVMNQIEANVRAIKEKEKTLSEISTESSESQTDKVLNDLNEIDKLMEANRKKLAQLQSLKNKLASINQRVEQYEHVIAEMQSRIDAQDIHITNLENALAEAAENISILTDENEAVKQDNTAKQVVIDRHETDINTVYYAVGTAKELQEKEIILKKGGVMGMGKTAILNPQIDNSVVLKADRRKMTEIETLSKKPQLITTHAESSYKWDTSEPDNVKLLITDVAKFWEKSKYLVIQVK